MSDNIKLAFIKKTVLEKAMVGECEMSVPFIHLTDEEGNLIARFRGDVLGRYAFDIFKDGLFRDLGNKPTLFDDFTKQYLVGDIGQLMDEFMSAPFENFKPDMTDMVFPTTESLAKLDEILTKS